MKKSERFYLFLLIAFTSLAFIHCKTDDGVAGPTGGGRDTSNPGDTGNDPNESGECVADPVFVGEWVRTYDDGSIEGYLFNEDGTGEEIAEYPDEGTSTEPFAWCMSEDKFHIGYYLDEEYEIGDISYCLDDTTLYLDAYNRSAGSGNTGTWVASETWQWLDKRGDGEINEGIYNELRTLVIDGNTLTHAWDGRRENDGETDEWETEITGGISWQGNSFVVTITDCQSNDSDFCAAMESQAAGCLFSDDNAIIFHDWEETMDCASEGYVKQ